MGNKRISIAISIYEYNGFGREVLDYSLQQIYYQTFKNFDVVVSDNSKDNKIENLCDYWSKLLDIKYYKNEGNKNSATENINNSIKKSSGEIIKLLCGDDYLLGIDSLQIINDNFDDNVNFLATGYLHTKDKKEYYNYHKPQMNDMIQIINTIGTPSCVSIRNFKDIPLFDSNLTYCYDCDFYRRYLDKYKNYKLIDNITMANYIWESSTTSLISNELIERENNYILKKYEEKII